MTNLVQSAAAGFTATLPMTAAMVALQQGYLPPSQRYALPPELITENFLKKLRLLGWRQKPPYSVTLFNHFAFGTFAGSLYGPLMKRIPLSPLIKGPLYGLAVWFGSYSPLGFVPQFGLMSSSRQIPRRRNAMMIIAHLIWGLSLGVMNESTVSLRPFRKRELES